MKQILTYSTSFLNDSFAIFHDGTPTGKLFKTSWIGSTVDVKTGGEEYRIQKKGIFSTQVTVTSRKDQKQVYIVGGMLPFLGLAARAKTSFPADRDLQWKQKGILNCSWEWIENGNTIVSSTEENGLFNINGEIKANIEKNDAELLGLLGLYLRSSIARQSLVSVGLALGILFFQIMRWNNN